MELQRLSIRQTYATIAIETQNARLDIESGPGKIEIESSPATMEGNTIPSELTIDSSRAWMALGKGNHLEWLHKITSQMEEEFLLNVSRIVDEGNQLAKGSSIADMMVQRIQEKSSIQYIGEASAGNVDLLYTPAEVELHWNSHHTTINYIPTKPLVSYEAGVADIYVKNKNSIQMWVSNYDLYG